MDLTVSPDVDALICYAITLIAGVIVAFVRVANLFGGSRIVWVFIQTWLLVLAYALVPPVLFWLLDRAGAINDTSLFAAVLIGFGYQQVITGSDGAIKTPSTLGTLWSPFLAW